MIFIVPSGPEWLERATIIREKQRLCEHVDLRVETSIYPTEELWITVCKECGKELDRHRKKYVPVDMWGYDLYKGKER